MGLIAHKTFVSNIFLWIYLHDASFILTYIPQVHDIVTVNRAFLSHGSGHRNMIVP